MRIVGIIEARMTSTRLPGKIMRPLAGRPALERLIERLRRARSIHGVTIATTTNSEDDVVEELGHELGVHVFRGSEHDVLDRVLKAARDAQADVIVEITGDCPLIDPEVVDRVVEAYLEGQLDFISNQLERTFPIGFDVRVFSTETLADVERSTDDPADREHVSLYLWEHPERFRIADFPSGLPSRYANLRLTLDTAQDLALISAIFEELYPRNPAFGMQDVLELVDRRPELLELNRDVRQKSVR